jgi:hypothetical protein
MGVKKYIKITLKISLVIFLGFRFYGVFVGKQSNEEVRASFERYFTDSDERIKMTYFSVDKNTVGLALELSGLGENIGLNDKAKIKSNSRKYIREKVCSDAQLIKYINDGNFVSIDIRNGDSGRLENIMNLSFSKGSCV